MNDAGKLEVRFAYSSNGQGFYAIDMQTGAESEIGGFPTPQELWDYCHRVTANDGALGEQHLRDFQDNEKTIPSSDCFVDFQRWLYMAEAA